LFPRRSRLLPELGPIGMTDVYVSSRTVCHRARPYPTWLAMRPFVGAAALTSSPNRRSDWRVPARGNGQRLQGRLAPSRRLPGVAQRGPRKRERSAMVTRNVSTNHTAGTAHPGATPYAT
jgi:hypothetical protein